MNHVSAETQTTGWMIPPGTNSPLAHRYPPKYFTVQMQTVNE